MQEKKAPAQTEWLLFGDVDFERLLLRIFKKHINSKFLKITNFVLG